MTTTTYLYDNSIFMSPTTYVMRKQATSTPLFASLDEISQNKMVDFIQVPTQPHRMTQTNLE